MEKLIKKVLNIAGRFFVSLVPDDETAHQIGRNYISMYTSLYPEDSNRQ